MRRVPPLLLGVALALLSTAAPAAAAPFPETIPVPAGSYPEGITVGRGTDVYVSSLFGGAVFAADLRTGEGAVAVPAEDGRAVAGLDFDRRSGLLWGVGSQDGEQTLFAFDPVAGTLVEALPVPGGLLNDLTVTREAVYLTDSFADVVWVVPLSARGLRSGPATPLPLTGDFEHVTTGGLPLNLNGITATPSGRWLLAVHSTLGVLYRVDPSTGEATEIDLGGAPVASGDGIVLQGSTLYVVQNFLNQVAVVRLDPALTSGEVVRTITDPDLDVPSTAALHGSSLYLVNARFDDALPPLFGAEPQLLDYDVVRVPR